MTTGEELPPDQQRAYELISSAGGMTQSELWKQLDANSRKGSRLAKALAKKSLISREETISNGRNTYFLEPTEGEDSSSEWADTKETTGTGGEEDGQPSNAQSDSREERALKLLQDRGGMYQSEFWKALDVSSRTGSRIATSLEEKDHIRRQETTHDGQRTYFLEPTEKNLDYALLMAGDQLSPTIGVEGFDPVESAEFSDWILRLAQER